MCSGRPRMYGLAVSASNIVESADAPRALALQLPFCSEVRALGFCLVRSAPE